MKAKFSLITVFYLVYAICYSMIFASTFDLEKIDAMSTEEKELQIQKMNDFMAENENIRDHISRERYGIFENVVQNDHYSKAEKEVAFKKILELSQQETQRFSQVKFQDLFFYVPVAIDLDELNSLIKDLKKLERDSKGNYLFYKTIPLEHLEAIREGGLNAKFGGIGGLSKRHTMSESMVSRDLGKMYLWGIYDRFTSCNINIHPFGMGYLRLHISPEFIKNNFFTANREYHFSGILPASAIDVKIYKTKASKPQDFLPLATVNEI